MVRRMLLVGSMEVCVGMVMGVGSTMLLLF